MKLIHLLSVAVGVLSGMVLLETAIVPGLLLVIGLLVAGGIYRSSKLYGKARVNHEIHALRRAFWFHPENDNIEKFVAVALIITWSIITIGVSFGVAEVTPEYTIITAIIWMFIGRLWGEEASDQLTD